MFLLWEPLKHFEIQPCMFCSCLAQIVSLDAPLLLCWCFRSWILTAACWRNRSNSNWKANDIGQFPGFPRIEQNICAAARVTSQRKPEFSGFPSASRDMHQQWGLQDNKEVTAESTNHTVQSSNVALLVKVALAASSHVQPRRHNQWQLNNSTGLYSWFFCCFSLVFLFFYPSAPHIFFVLRGSRCA